MEMQGFGTSVMIWSGFGGKGSVVSPNCLLLFTKFLALRQSSHVLRLWWDYGSMYCIVRQSDCYPSFKAVGYLSITSMSYQGFEPEPIFLFLRFGGKAQCFHLTIMWYQLDLNVSKEEQGDQIQSLQLCKAYFMNTLYLKAWSITMFYLSYISYGLQCQGGLNISKLNAFNLSPAFFILIQLSFWAVT